jgi:thymidylate synthase
MIILPSEILSVCSGLIEEINTEGEVYKTTKEILGLGFYIHIEELDLDQEELFIRNYYGERYERRAEEEKFHYEQLKYSLLHKVKEVQYFFNQNIENRKIIVFSNDCISLAQYLRRKDLSILMVYMRSSDVKDLLPIDLLNLARILKAINKEYPAGVELIEIVDVTIGSAHYYLKGGRV